MKLQLISTLTFLTASMAAPAALQSVAPPTAQIASVSYGGTGCPQSTLEYVLSNDLKSLNLLYPNEYVAAVGPNISITESRKNCQVSLAIKHTPGYSYAVTSSSYIGRVSLEKGVTGLQKVTYYYAGETAQADDSNTWSGPVDRTYYIKNDASSHVWSNCDGTDTLNINSQVRLDSTSENLRGSMTNDVGRITLGVGIVWKKC